MCAFKWKEESYGCPEITGFSASGVHCDVRGKQDGRLDLALLVSECPCTAAGVFTRNKLAAAPVTLDRKILAEEDYFKGVVINSGNANACTGEAGMNAAIQMQQAAADALGCKPAEIFVCSTGRIGEALPMQRITAGISEAVSALGSGRESGYKASDAILTSDTRRKVCSVEIETGSGTLHIAGMAKGAGMIEPNMATMLAFICTDAALNSTDAQDLLAECVNESFNAITVDGDESTNDTVLFLANGSSGIHLDPEHTGWLDYKDALMAVCRNLALKIVGDGEKITKVVELSIDGAATKDDAEKAARAVANSLLVKSSWYGNDPNWGRIMDAIGYSGADTGENFIRLWYAGMDSDERTPVFTEGAVHADNKARWKDIVSKPRFRIIADLGMGSASSRVWSTDLTEGYINFNKSE